MALPENIVVKAVDDAVGAIHAPAEVIGAMHRPGIVVMPGADGMVVPGDGVISGVITRDGEPAVRLVRVHRRVDGRLLGEAWSAEDGSYVIEGLLPGIACYVIALDSEYEYNAAVADNVMPVNS